MTFCTACASPMSTTGQSCPSCGELTEPGVALNEGRRPGVSPASRSILLRMLYLAPVLLIFTVAGGFVQRQTAEQQWLASAYASAQGAATAGDLVTARERFSAIAGYRDAATQAREMEALLEPLEAG